MADTESLYGQEINLKVGNYRQSIFEAIDEAKHFISHNHCPFLNVDISGLNLIDAIKVCVLSTTFHYTKYCNGKIKWLVKDTTIKEQIELLKLDNAQIVIKQPRQNFSDSTENKAKKLRLCK